jgi:hypothetical protein
MLWPKEKIYEKNIEKVEKSIENGEKILGFSCLSYTLNIPNREISSRRIEGYIICHGLDKLKGFKPFKPSYRFWFKTNLKLVKLKPKHYQMMRLEKINRLDGYRVWGSRINH